MTNRRNSLFENMTEQETAIKLEKIIRSAAERCIATVEYVEESLFTNGKRPVIEA